MYKLSCLLMMLVLVVNSGDGVCNVEGIFIREEWFLYPPTSMFCIRNILSPRKLVEKFTFFVLKSFYPRE